MAPDVEYTVRLAEILKPYRLKWIEDYLLPGTAVIRDGSLIPSDAPGFGLEMDQDWLEMVSV